jgi:2,3-bisphosphoglycerate-dependent phosphoglycerate mutase
MSTKGKLVLFRHGETWYSRNHWMTGWRDIGLTPEGEEQARNCGRMLAGIRFDKAFSSTLSRSFNTAAYALEYSGSNEHLRKGNSWDIEERTEIMEGSSGDFSGRDKTEPEIANYPRGYDIPLPNGESDKQMVERVRKFYEEEILPRMERGETVMVAAHAGIVAAFEIVAGLKPEPTTDIWSKRGNIPTATPVIYEYDDGKLANHYQMG